MRGFSTIVFDLDGTLLDTIEDLHLALDHALESEGLPTRTFEEARAFVGNGIRRLCERGVPEGSSPAVVDAVFAEFNRWYAAHCNDHTHAYTGMVELVGALRGEGRRMAVVSNKSDYAVQDLMDIYFPGAFDAVLGVREGVARKPARDMVDAALAEMDAEAQADARAGHAVYVGDSEVDVQTAANAEMPCISVSWGFRSVEQLVEAGATHIVATTAELAQAIREGR